MSLLEPGSDRMTAAMLRRWLGLLLCVWASTVSAQAPLLTPPPSAVAMPAPVPVLIPIELNPATLKPGEFVWLPEIAPAGPLVIVVSIPEQKAYV